MKIYISHGAEPDSPDWFVVEGRRSIAGTRFTPEQAAESLLRAGRTVYELDTEAFRNGRFPLKPVGPRP